MKINTLCRFYFQNFKFYFSMDTTALIDELTKIGISILLGGALGLEREYQNKPAGFRTVALICIGATAFTILPINLPNFDRLSSRVPIFELPKPFD